MWNATCVVLPMTTSEWWINCAAVRFRRVRCSETEFRRSRPLFRRNFQNFFGVGFSRVRSIGERDVATRNERRLWRQITTAQHRSAMRIQVEEETSHPAETLAAQGLHDMQQQRRFASDERGAATSGAHCVVVFGAGRSHGLAIFSAAVHDVVDAKARVETAEILVIGCATYSDVSAQRSDSEEEIPT